MTPMIVSRHVRACSITFGLAILGLCAGCDQRQNPALLAVQNAQRQMAILTGEGSGVSPSIESRRGDFLKVLDALKGVGSDSPLAPIAAGLAGKAKAALANLDGVEANKLGTELTSKLASIRTNLDGWARHSSFAASMSRFDQQAESAPYRESLARVESSLAEASRAQAESASRADSIASSIAYKRSESQRARSQAASLKAMIDRGSAQAGLSLMEQSAASRRTADGLDIEVTQLETDMNIASRAAESGKATVAVLTAEKQRLESEIASLAERAAAASRAADEARKSAKNAADSIAAGVHDVNTFKSQSLDSAYAKALSGAREAVGLMKSASKGGDASSSKANKLAVAGAEQTVADMLVSQARSHESIAQTFALLASVEPALPKSSAYRVDATTAGKSFDDLIGQARETYKSVADQLGSVNDPKLKEKLDAAKAALESLASKQGVKEIPVEKPAAAPAQDGSNAAAIAEVRKVVDQFCDLGRNDNLEGMTAIMDFKSDGDKDAFLVLARGMRSALKLDQACKAKFGKTFAEFMGAEGAGAQMFSMGSHIEVIKSRTASDYDITVASDGLSATTMPKQPLEQERQATKLVKKNGQWKMQMTAMGEGGAQAMTMMLKPLFDAFEDLASGVESGKITDADQMMSILKQKAPMIGGMLGGNKPGGDEPNK